MGLGDCIQEPEAALAATARLDWPESAWHEFLRREAIEADPALPGELHSARTVLVAGAGGSIGSHLARQIAAEGPRLLVLLDHSEQNLHAIHEAVTRSAPKTKTAAVLASVCDGAAMEDLFERHRPDLIYHAAAYKHVPLVERNPVAGLANNVLGTWILAKTAVRHHAAALLALSTDKAANPRSVLGVSKRIAELALLAPGGSRTRMNSLRLGNVLGSQGSVAPQFLGQIAHGGPVTVAHPEVRRYFLTIEEAGRLIFSAAAHPTGGQILAPELGEQIRIADLAEFLIRRTGLTPGRDIAVSFTALRPGDKLSEELIAPGERKGAAVGRWLYQVVTPTPSAKELEQGIEDLSRAVNVWDATGALAVVRRLAPEYRPSRELVAALGLQAVGATPVSAPSMSEDPT